MTTILILAASVLGLIIATLAMALFNTGPLVALAMWTATGLSATGLALLWSLIPRRQRSTLSTTSH